MKVAKTAHVFFAVKFYGGGGGGAWKVVGVGGREIAVKEREEKKGIRKWNKKKMENKK